MQKPAPWHVRPPSHTSDSQHGWETAPQIWHVVSEMVQTVPF